MSDQAAARQPETGVDVEELGRAVRVEPEYRCDRCGETMVENNCKIICRNCGHRFDCSDLNLYFD